jgi:hypothetical protein
MNRLLPLSRPSASAVTGAIELAQLLDVCSVTRELAGLDFPLAHDRFVFSAVRFDDRAELARQSREFAKQTIGFGALIEERGRVCAHGCESCVVAHKFAQRLGFGLQFRRFHARRRPGAGFSRAPLLALRRGSAPLWQSPVPLCQSPVPLCQSAAPLCQSPRATLSESRGTLPESPRHSGRVPRHSAGVPRHSGRVDHRMHVLFGCMGSNLRCSARPK